MVRSFAVQIGPITEYDAVKVVKVDAVTTWRGKRQAQRRVLKTLPEPRYLWVMLEREAAIIIRQAVERMRPKMDVQALNGTSPMCFDNRYEPYQFD